MHQPPRILDAPDVVELMDKMRIEYSALLREVTAACGQLDGAVQKIDTSKKKWFCADNAKELILLAVVACVCLAMYFVPSFDVNIGSIKITKHECIGTK